MPRYAANTDTNYDAVDYPAIIAKKLTPLGLSPTDPVYQVVSRMMRGARSWNTVDSYGNEISHFLRWCQSLQLEPFELSEDDLEMYISCIANYAPRTQKLKLLTARLFYKVAMRKGWCQSNPVIIPVDLRRTGYAGKTPVLTKLQVEELLGAIRADFDHPIRGLSAKRDYALIMLMVRLFLRATETRSLRWNRFVESDGRRFITFTGKGRKEPGWWSPTTCGRCCRAGATPSRPGSAARW